MTTLSIQWERNVNSLLHILKKDFIVKDAIFFIEYGKRVNSKSFLLNRLNANQVGIKHHVISEKAEMINPICAPRNF